jgi:hypothetical protein
MHADLILKELAESIGRKEFAKDHAEGSAKILFDLEIAEATDQFQARCMILLAAALEMDDYIAIIRYFELLEASASPELIRKIYSNLFALVVKEILSKIDIAAKDSVIKRLRIFDENSEE